MELTAVEWERVEALLPEALSLPRGEREPFLRRHCGDSDRLRTELESLIAAGDTAEGFLAGPVAVTSDAPPEPDLLAPGTRLGPWKVGETIGRGGMGEVYAASRDDGQFRMDAALKILKRGLDTREVLRRFDRERNILARLSHPNIARLLDAGATADGRPYYVMERVEGKPITEHCTATAASLEAILRLMCAVCDAVGAAHRSLVVHRDLKPSNVLVTAAGEVKLLDFGIAKLLSEGDAEGTRTAMEQQMLTPAYAAPEQILGQAVSTASDVYALGVILFRLLTGELPQRREGALFAGDVRNEITRRPSAAVRAGKLPAAEARRRARELAGDLDLIILKALHSEPERRYRSAFELADDLQRYLERRPVLARPDSLGYRAGRFVQRYPVPVAAASAAVLALIGGLAASMYLYRQALAARHEAEAVSAFMSEDMLAMGDPYQGKTIDTSLPALLNRAAGLVDQRLAGQPAAAAKVRLAIGLSFLWQGDLDAAGPQLEAALPLLAQVDGGTSDDYIEARKSLAAVHANQGRKDQAASLFRETLDDLQRRVAPDAYRVLELRTEIARYLLEPAQSVPELREVLRLGANAVTPRGKPSIEEVALFWIGPPLIALGEYAEAENTQRRMIEATSRHLGDAHYFTSWARLGHAVALVRLGRHEEAEADLSRASHDLDAWLGTSHFQTVVPLRDLGLIRLDQNRFPEAQQFLEEAMRRCSAMSHCADGYSQVIRTYLAWSYQKQGRFQDAIQLLEGVQAERARTQGETAPATVRTRLFIADAQRAAGRPRLARQLLDSIPPLVPDKSAEVLRLELSRVEGLLRFGEGRIEEARKLLVEAEHLAQANYGQFDWRTRRLRDEIAAIPDRGKQEH